MNCKNHMETESVFVCTVCGEPLCTDCAVELGRNICCRECLNKIVEQKTGNKAPVKKSWWLAMLLSLVPGTGHMYLGLVKKGTTIMALLFSLVFLIILLSESSAWLAGYLIPSLCFMFLSYSIFDCISLTSRINAGEDLQNEGIYELGLLKELIIRRKGLFSLVLIISGSIGIVNIFSKVIGEVLFNLLGVHFSIAAFLIPLLLIILGFYLLREGRSRRF